MMSTEAHSTEVHLSETYLDTSEGHTQQNVVY